MANFDLARAAHIAATHANEQKEDAIRAYQSTVDAAASARSMRYQRQTVSAQTWVNRANAAAADALRYARNAEGYATTAREAHGMLCATHERAAAADPNSEASRNAANHANDAADHSMRANIAARLARLNANLAAIEARLANAD